MEKEWIQLGEYSLKQTIGKGAFGEVFLAQHDSNLRQFAIKRIPAFEIKKSPQMKQLLQDEANITSQIDHPNIVHLMEFLCDGDYYYLCYEYCEEGNDTDTAAI